jgi:hypothetical protein
MDRLNEDSATVAELQAELRKAQVALLANRRSQWVVIAAMFIYAAAHIVAMSAWSWERGERLSAEATSEMRLDLLMSCVDRTASLMSTVECETKEEEAFRLNCLFSTTCDGQDAQASYTAPENGHPSSCHWNCSHQNKTIDRVSP